MTLTDSFQRFENSLSANMRNSFAAARRAYHQQRIFRQTFDELNSLNDRELRDLGIARSEIKTLAREAVKNK